MEVKHVAGLLVSPGETKEDVYAANHKPRKVQQFPNLLSYFRHRLLRSKNLPDITEYHQILQILGLEVYYHIDCKVIFKFQVEVSASQM
jgi:hypothetical protein